MQFLFTKGIPQSSAIHLKLWKALGIKARSGFQCGRDFRWLIVDVFPLENKDLLHLAERNVA